MAELSRLLQGNVDVGKFERDKVENDAQLRQRRDLEVSISMRIGETKNQIESLEKQISALQLATDKNKRVNTYIAYAQRIYEWFKKSYDEKEKDVKDELYTSINTLFKQMYHGERIVEVDDKYHITLKVDSGNGVFK